MMEGNQLARIRDKKGRFKKGTTISSTIGDVHIIDENNNETEDVSSDLEACHCDDDRDDFSRSSCTSIFDGRRIVDFSVLVEHLERGCFMCHTPLNLAKCVKERQYGLASLLYIECTSCKELTIVPTGKRHNIGANGQGPFDVNTKLGVGMHI